MKTLITLLKSEDGATAIEYALIAALVSIAAILAMSAVGNSVRNSFSKVSSTVTSANSR